MDTSGLQKIKDEPNYQQCIVKEELIIPDSDEEIKSEKIDETFDCGTWSSENVASVKLENINECSEKSNSTTNADRGDVLDKTSRLDTNAVAKKVAKAYCKKCRKESTVYPYKARCNVCNTSFSYNCHVCNKTYKTFTHLGIHIKAKHVEFKLVHICSICDKTFSYRKGLMDHRKIYHNSLKCSKCDKEFSKPGNKLQHEKVCGELASYKCEQCSFTTRYKSNLRSHKRDKHSEFKAQCEKCNKQFTNRRVFSRHQKIYCNKTKTLECDYCGRMVYRKDQMVKHLHHLHKVYRKTRDGNEQYQDECANQRVKQEIDQNQSATFEDDTPDSRICKYCDSALKPFEHTRFHVERCESAPLSIRCSANMSKHPSIDAALRNLGRTYCSSCKSQEPLKHQVRRCGICDVRLSFWCTSCSKNCDKLCHLRDHLRVNHVRHLKFYRCDKCQCYYKHKKNLFKHQKDFHSDKQTVVNYKCSNCGKNYKGSDSLRKHMIRCTEEPKFYCDKCPYKTHFKSSLIEHFKAKRATCI